MILPRNLCRMTIGCSSWHVQRLYVTVALHMKKGEKDRMFLNCCFFLTLLFLFMGFSLSSPLYESMRCFTLARNLAVKTSHISRPGNSTYSAQFSSKRITKEYLAYSVETARFSMLSTSLIRQGCPRIPDTRKTSSRQSKKLEQS